MPANYACTIHITTITYSVHPVIPLSSSQDRLCYWPPPLAPGLALLPASTKLHQAWLCYQPPPNCIRLCYQPPPNCIRLGSSTSLYHTASDLALLPASTKLHQARLCYQPPPPIGLRSASIKAIYEISGVITELLKKSKGSLTAKSSLPCHS